jgi:uroporphyrinogen decarboxylase
VQVNDRDRFNATMHYRAWDRSPLLDFGFWEETFVVWQRQGLPERVDKRNSHLFFGMDFDLDAAMGATGVEVGLVPLYEEVVLEDHGDREVIQQENGVRVLRHKFMSSIPKPIRHLLTDRASWRKHYKQRLNPMSAERFPTDWDERVKVWGDAEREYPIFLPGGSLYGWLRNWMGMEHLSLVLYDDPAWFEEMVTTVADCIIGTLSRVLETGGQFDGCAMWEDMCYNGGPLMSPKHFKRFLVPHYRRIVDLLHRHGVDVIWVDCDGRIDKLLPLWLESGINCMFPMEVGTWGADPIRYRRVYGKELLMMGGFDKRILASSKGEIEAEVHRLAPLVEEGGFIGFCDHRVPPDVPLENYWFYLETARRVWGEDVDLRPMGQWGPRAASNDCHTGLAGVELSARDAKGRELARVSEQEVKMV